jgi:ribosomal protein S18 acetylase RimI-like enzyme
MTDVQLRSMAADDYEEVRRLWEDSPGVGLSDADSRAGVERYLRANPGMSMVAVRDGRIIGAALCGHDGRRGYLSHLVVHESYRRSGAATAIVNACVAALRGAGMDKCHVLVFTDNEDALAFYRSNGWIEREELLILSRFTEDQE